MKEQLTEIMTFGNTQLVRITTPLLALNATETSFHDLSNPIEFRWPTSQGLLVDTIQVTSSLQDNTAQRFWCVKNLVVNLDLIDSAGNPIIYGGGKVAGIPVNYVSQFYDSFRVVQEAGESRYLVDNVYGFDVASFSGQFEALPTANFKMYVLIRMKTFERSTG